MDRMQTIKKVFILGNGFDIDLGIKTRYSDFAKSNEWKLLMRGFAGKPGHMLLKYMKTKEFTEEWFDIEAAMLEYAIKASSNNMPYNVIEDEKDYKRLCDALGKYLNGIKYVECDCNSCAARLTRLINGLKDNQYIYSFNFTPLDKYVDYINGRIITNINYIHGTLSESNYILGFECDDIKSIRKEYSFMYKSNNINYKSCDLSDKMRHTHEVVIFGHSLNPIDFVYFKDYFHDIMQYDEEGENKRILTIISRDEYSERTIKDNIRSMGISIPELAMHVKLRFIKTTNVKNKIGNDNELFEELLNE